MMSNLKIASLDDMCDLNMGQSPESSSYNEEGIGIPFFQGNADFGELYPITRYWCSEPTKIANKDDILISVRAPIGALNIATEKCCIGRGLAALTALPNTYNKYLFYALKNKHDELNAKGTGSTFKAINKKTLAETSIQFPPLETQKKIADVLDKAKSLIDLRKKQIEKMDLLIKSKFIEMFGDPVTNPKGWERTEIVRICEKIAGGGTPSKSQPDYYTGKIPWVTPKDMKKTLINDSIDHITEEAINNSSTKIIPKGSLLMVIRSGILKKTLPIAITIVPVSINQDMKAFIVNAKVNVWFLYYTLKILEPVLLSKVRGVTADNIEFDVIKNLRIPLPPLPLQSQFASFVEVIENQKNLLEQGLDKIEISYKSLMQEYFG